MDILFLAAIAAFILYRLYRVLGQDVGIQNKPHLVEPTTQNFSSTVKMEHKSSGEVNKAIHEYKKYDTQFELQAFLEGARGAFEMVLKAYTEADREALDHLLASSLRKQFETSLKNREKRKEDVDNSLIRIKNTELLGIEIEKKQTAIARVKFESDQILVTYNAQGHLIEGDPDQIESISEVWTFKRDINSSDPNWKLYETESLV